MSENKASREVNWLFAIEGRREKQCKSKKPHKRHIWNGPEPYVEGWYCLGLEVVK